jgi:hypothetical protein
MSSCYVSLLKIGHGELTTSPPGRFTVVRALYSFTHLCLFVGGGDDGNVWLTKEDVLVGYHSPGNECGWRQSNRSGGLQMHPHASLLLLLLSMYINTIMS